MNDAKSLRASMGPPGGLPFMKLHPALVHVLSGADYAGFLDHCLFLQGMAGDVAWWQRTFRELVSETGFSQTQIRRIRQRLLDLRLIRFRRASSVGGASEYRVDLERLRNYHDWAVGSYQAQVGVTKPTNRFVDNQMNVHLPADKPFISTSDKTDVQEPLTPFVPYVGRTEDPKKTPEASTPVQLTAFADLPDEPMCPRDDAALFSAWWQHVKPKRGRSGALKKWLAGLLDRPSLAAEVANAKRPELAHHALQGVSVLIARRLEWQRIMAADWGEAGAPFAVYPQGWLNQERWTREELDALEEERQQRVARDEARRESNRHRRVDASVFVPELPYRDPDLEAQRARVRAARLAREREQASQAGTAPAGPCPHSASGGAQGAIRPPADLGYQGRGDRRSEAARGGRADGPDAGETVKREGGLT